MIKSMTGYGRGKKTGKHGRVGAELRSVNHRSFELTCRLPENCLVLEPKIKELIAGKVRRGKLHLVLFLEPKSGAGPELRFDEQLARSYYLKLKKLKRQLNLKGDVTLREIAFQPGIFSFQTRNEEKAEQLWPDIRAAVALALEQLVKMRAGEGAFLAKALFKEAQRIEKSLTKTKKRAPLVIERYRKRLARRLKAVGTLNEARIEQEVGIFAQNSDITEEITRIRSHLAGFLQALKGDSEVGKKLDFIAQELHREVNTLASKQADSLISRQAVEMKSAIEKIREQVQNLE